ncbi:unnamed protein product [Polarella glacialis]|uniref:Uncharacterized protein n=1 Tax=Polarella glacialis TaxID=89957 RepID=A0A813GPR7_POLGL|nr:unnamed protein product [Polarella glacialis]
MRRPCARLPRCLWLVVLLLQLSEAYLPWDHSCSWFRDASDWHWLRRRADDHLSGRQKWSPSERAARLTSDMRCPVGNHVRHLLDLDARGAARDLSVEGCWKMMFGVYNSFDFLDIALSGVCYQDKDFSDIFRTTVLSSMKVDDDSHYYLYTSVRFSGGTNLFRGTGDYKTKGPHSSDALQ